MYISRSNQKRFELACKVLALALFDNDPEERSKVGLTIKEIAAHTGVSRNQTYEWKHILSREDPKLFELCKPGRKPKEVSALREPVLPSAVADNEQVLISESISRVAVRAKQVHSRTGQWTAELRLEILRERDRLKHHGLTYERFAERLGLGSGLLRLWNRKLKTEGLPGLENKSRAPKYGETVLLRCTVLKK